MAGPAWHWTWPPATSVGDEHACGHRCVLACARCAASRTPARYRCAGQTAFGPGEGGAKTADGSGFGVVWISAGPLAGAAGACRARPARGAIRATVRRYRARLKDAAPTGMIAALVAAACMPVVYPLLGQVPESAKAAVELLGATGGVYLTEFVKDVIGRLRGRDGAPRSQDQLQQALEHRHRPADRPAAHRPHRATVAGHDRCVDPARLHAGQAQYDQRRVERIRWPRPAVRADLSRPAVRLRRAPGRATSHLPPRLRQHRASARVPPLSRTRPV